jgi:hypothetical protein
MRETTVKVVDFPVSTSRDFQLANENEEAGVTYVHTSSGAGQEYIRLKVEHWEFTPNNILVPLFKPNWGLGRMQLRKIHTHLFFKGKNTHSMSFF